MLSISSSYESTLTERCLLKKLLEKLSIFVAHLLRRLILKLQCLFLNFQSMFVNTYWEKRVSVSNLIEPVNSITVYCSVQMANVRLGIDVEDGRHDIWPLSWWVAHSSSWALKQTNSFITSLQHHHRLLLCFSCLFVWSEIMIIIQLIWATKWIFICQWGFGVLGFRCLTWFARSLEWD